MRCPVCSLVALAVLAPGAGRSQAAPGAATVWPGEEWATATPESQGLASAALDEAAAFAAQHGGGSGCVIRHGYLVKEWGDAARLADIKSATKGSVGATLLALAIDDGLVRLDDAARGHSPELGSERPENVATGWLGEITVEHLATMTAGFDDGRPPRLVRRPGTGGEYSNDTSNMLAELLTLRFKSDLRDVFRRRLADPIGLPPAQWAWRDNAYRPRSVSGLASREFASGITITHRALARLGYLYLRDGEWNGRRLLTPGSVRLATRPTDLPRFVPYYAFYWGSNDRGTYPAMPRDACWALGLGDSFVLFCRSLDIVLVRLGTGSTASQLPGGDRPEDWGKRVAGLFRRVAAAVQDGSPPAVRTPLTAPYPPSPVIEGIKWAPAASIVRRARGSDNWPLAWADDGALYAAFGDGNGFEPFTTTKLSLGFARIDGTPDEPRGVNISSPTGERRGDGPAGLKASGLLSVGGVLYLWARNAGNGRLAWSADHAVTWTWAEWKLEASFGCPTFLVGGKDGAGAGDGFVYLYSPDAETAYQPADRFILARAPRDRLRERAAYELLERLDGGGQPVWTAELARRGAVLTHPGKCWRSSVAYNAGLGRYLWCQTLPGGDPRFAGGFGIYDAPEPWGPWTTVFYSAEWDVGPGETQSFPPKWMSDDGRTLHLVFSGDDCFSVRRAQLQVRAAAPLRRER